MSAADDQLALDLGTPAAPRIVARPSEGARPRTEDVALREEQLAVVRFDTDLVVTAGAGSGKTRTLVALYAAILADSRFGVDGRRLGPSDVLCLTFTERAARELALKVRDRLSDPAALRSLESADVTTFHAWCARLLRRHPLEAGVDPRFGILTEDAAEDLLRRAAVETLRRGLEDGDRAARQAVELVGLERGAQTLADLVRALRTAGWRPRRAIERFEERLAEIEVRRAPLAAELDARLDELLAVARTAGLHTENQLRTLAKIEAAAARWRREPGSGTAEELGRLVRSAGRSWRFSDSVTLRDPVCEAATDYAALAVEIESRFQLGGWPALTASVRAAYRAARFARGVLDYDDLVLKARDLLAERDDIRHRERRRYRVVLVDEHQDTDPVQDEILRLLIGERALAGEPDPDAPRWCVVGDAQQSIYGFRGATVAAFEDLARRAAGRGARRTLATNYRSRVALVGFHNALFPTVLVAGERADQVGYLPQEAFRGTGDDPAVELLDPEGLDAPAAEARETEARALAARVAAACRQGDPDAIEVHDPVTGETRTARPGDVAILLRRLTQVETYRRALDGAELESVVVGSGSFYGRQEVFDALNALEAALHPDDPVPLVGFLRSPMVGLPDDALWELLRDFDRGMALSAHLAEPNVTTRIDPAEAERLADGLAVLEGVRTRADRQPPGAVLAWLVDRTGYAAVLDALPDKGQRRANLERLVTLADRAPGDGLGLLSEWTSALRRRVERPPRERDASFPEAGDRVRVLSIHQAKGLEFPIVALADIGGRVQSGSTNVAFDPQLGVVARVWDDPAAKPRGTASWDLAARAAAEREAAEEGRLLYVAATRARDHLILSAGAPDGDWLRRLRAFADTPAAADLLAVRPLAGWEARFSDALGQAPPLVEPGRAVRASLPAAPGEAPARELAAALTGGVGSGASPAAAARAAAEEARRRGARGHAALEHAPLDDGEEALAKWLDGPGGLPPDEARGLAAFVARHVAPRLAGAAELAREHPFRLRLPGAGTVTGTIDAVWRNADGEWWVGDYKFAEHEPRDAERHAAQLAIYALATAAALGLERIRGCLWYVDERRVEEAAWTVAELTGLEARLADALRGLAGPPR